MGDLIVDLKRSLMTPDEDFVKVIDPDEDGSTKMITDSDMERIKNRSKSRDSMEEAMHLRKESDVKKSVKRKQIPKKYIPVEEEEEDEEEEDVEESYESEYEYYEEDEEDEDEEEDYDPKMERLTTVLAVIAAILVGCVVLFLVGRAFGLFDSEILGDKKETQEAPAEEEKEQVEMVDVVGKDIDDVKVTLLNIGLTPEIEYEESTEYGQGIVMKAGISAGTMVEEGTNVVLTVSAGSEGVKVPDVIGMSEAEATATLSQSGFVVNKTEDHDPYIKVGNIVTQTPEADSKVPAGTAVTIRVSLGPEESKVRVPDVMGKDESEAMAILVEAGLQMGVVTEVNHEDPALSGLVCYQSYSVGSYVEEGTLVDVSISVGPAQASYKFTDAISAPTPEEDPNYKSGTLVTVTLMADDGTQLLSTQASSFPIPQQSISGIKCETGYILYQYVNVTDATTVTNEDGSTNTIEGTSEGKEIRRPVQFAAE